MKGQRRTKASKGNLTAAERTAAYRHPEAESLLRPDVGTQAQFRKRKPPATYRYDSSLDPVLHFDGKNPARELGEWLLTAIYDASRLPAPHQFADARQFRSQDGKLAASIRGLADAVDQLKRIGGPYLNWAGKAERVSFQVPTLPLFVHERLSTKAIVTSLEAYRKKGDTTQTDMFEMFGDPQRAISDQVLKAYEYTDKWVNRLVLGDSLVVMNSLLNYESLGGHVQMIYMDPPYGVKYGSNFQPFVRTRDVEHADDEDMTREPEMVKAYRDTWELGLHSYLTYLRDRLLLCRDLLAPTGSLFVQISDENLHHVRELLDEVMGPENFCRVIAVAKTSGLGATLLPVSHDYLLWYAKDASQVYFQSLYLPRANDGDYGMYRFIDESGRRYRIDNLTGQNNNVESCLYEYEFNGRKYGLPSTRQWKTTRAGMDALVKAGRVVAAGSGIYYKRYFDDFPFVELTDAWDDTGSGGFTEPKIYSVQTNQKIVQRCILMTTRPGELVLDPTCGSGTTARVAEEWGRRWIAIDVSRVPLALARQRLLTATYPYYSLKDKGRGPVGGFEYVAKKNGKGEDVGGIIPHVTLKSIARNEPHEQELIVDNPEVDTGIIRVTGPFWVEATIPTPVDWDGDGQDDGGESEAYGSFVERMIEVLRRSPILHLGGGKSVTLRNIRPPTKTLSLSAEGVVANGKENLVAVVFGPENGAVSERLVHEAAKEAVLKQYSYLYVIGFAIQPNARKLVDECEAVAGIPASYIQATPDLMMGTLLKNMRSSQIFSVCGLPEVEVSTARAPGQLQVELVGLDLFDPVTMETVHHKGEFVPAWFLDTDYNNLCFNVRQAFFPRTSAWDNLKRSLKGSFDDRVWNHLAGTTSAPFAPGEHGQIAVKVIDDRGNELMVVKSVKGGKK